MGISPIEYHAWKGERTAQNLRLYVIARSIFRHKTRSMGVLILLILGFLLVHILYLVLIIIVPHEELTGSDMNTYLGGGVFAVFSILLAAVVTSDLISEDLASNSFVLYFSRALRVGDYLAGKAVGALLVMSLFCFIPPVAIAFVSIATQTGSDYADSFVVLGETALVGALVTLLFVPFGLMMSSFTNRKSYAAVGTFMSFFVLAIVAEIFSEFDSAWNVVSPVNALSYLMGWIFEGDVPYYVSESTLVAIMAAMIIVPSFIVYFRLTRQVVGK